jgi:hypothetical protein
MSEDPKLFDAGDYNLFRYCHNDPIDFEDPMGLASDTYNFADLSPREVSRRLADEQYGKDMAAAQWAGSDLMHNATGAIGIGMTANNQQLTIRSGVTPENYGSPATPFRMTSKNISVDYDGTPGAYGGPSHGGVETLANAGPGDTTIAYKNGRPVVEHGDYVSKTSFHRGDQTVQANNINGSVYPYAALGNRQTFGARPGDVVYAVNHLSGKGTWMVYGDYRGRRNTGLEFSPAALNSLGIPFRGNNVRPTPVTMFVYPGSASGDFP